MHKNTFRPTPLVQACRLAIAALALAGGSAQADSFTLPNGVEGQWSLNATMGASWRAADRDIMLVAAPNGGFAGVGNGQDDGNLNFNKGSAFTSGPKLSGELQLKQDNYGLFLRANAWYDATLHSKKVEHGSFANRYIKDRKLSDAGFYPASKFDGVALADAYVFGTFELAENMPLTVKAGNQVLNWGESTFIPGVNGMGAFDLSAARRPGAQVKEILRPLQMVSANLGLGNGLSFEAFYQYKWNRTVIDGCGTYWSPADSLNCGSGAVVFGDSVGNDKKQYDGVPILGALPPALLAAMGGAGLGATPINFRVGRAAETRPKDGGEFGLSSHYFASSISTDFGLYYTNYHPRVPFVSVVKTASDAPSIYSGQYAQVFNNLKNFFAAQGNAAAAKQFGTLAAFPAAQINWGYGTENTHAIGLSAATEVAGFSLFGEMSLTKGVPVQINVPDLLVGSVLRVGPQAAMGVTMHDPAVADGTLVKGYDLKDKSQIQMSFVRIMPQLLGASALTVVGEVGMQHWNGIGDPATSTRYGRGFLYGFGPTKALGGTCAGINTVVAYCENEGYATANAWGYRLQAELNYPNVVAGINLKPKLFWSHDVKGYSADSTFIKDRQTLGMVLRADYNNKYYTEVSLTKYNKNAKYDAMHDRDYYSFVAGINF